MLNHASATPRQVTLPDGTRVPALGQGSWKMGERDSDRAAEARALRLGIDLGLTLIDTAEIYADGGSEEVVGEAIKGRRSEVFLVSKIHPRNAGPERAKRACEASLKRIGTDHLDLYLLHWRGNLPLGDTVEAFEALVREGKIRRWGVSNLDPGDMVELLALPGGEGCAMDQVLYNPEHRGIEFDLLPMLAEKKIPVMAYSPVGQGGALLRHRALRTVAARHGVSAAQVALAWVMRHHHVIAIPKSGSEAHVRENAQALSLPLSAEDLAEIDRGFAPPRRAVPLATL